MAGNGELVLGAGLIAFLTEIIMRVTPESFDRARFAALCNVIIALALSILEAQFKSGITIWDAVLRGIILAMGSAGAYDAVKIYGTKAVNGVTGKNKVS